jgi:hypothetical protein
MSIEVSPRRVETTLIAVAERGRFRQHLFDWTSMPDVTGVKFQSGAETGG